jgi:hypothetical protein
MSGKPVRAQSVSSGTGTLLFLPQPECVAGEALDARLDVAGKNLAEQQAASPARE